MPFSTETEQIKKFENDEVAQHYFEVLRTLISKKSIFAQQVGLQEVANYLGEIFTAAGAKVMIDDSYTAPFVLAEFLSSNPVAITVILTVSLSSVESTDVPQIIFASGSAASVII